MEVDKERLWGRRGRAERGLSGGKLGNGARIGLVTLGVGEDG
jgi:hypothetical protein